jgi:uncharacterized protein
MQSAIGMLLVLTSLSRSTAFSVVVQSQAPRRSGTRLLASFLDNLQKSFSTAVTPGSSMSKYYTIGITGSSGLVGTALQDELASRASVNGKPVRIVRLQRGSVVGADDKALDDAPLCSLTWNPNGAVPSEIIGTKALSEMDTVVHLAGENVSTGLGPLGFLGLRPWTAEKKSEIMNSRVTSTLALSKAMAALSSRPQTLLTASGVGIYGDTFVDDTQPAVDETAMVSDTTGFLADVSRAWEEATLEASKKGNNRVVNARFGVVLSTKGGAMSKVYPIFFLGGGGTVGSGQQYLPFVSARDLARALIYMMETPSLKGPVNVCAPNPCTNSEYTKALGSAMGRPTIFPFPSFAVSLLFGEMGETLLLGGTRCVPQKLLKSGFTFLHPTVDSAVQSALKEKI